MIKVYNTKTGITISIDTPLGQGIQGKSFTLKDLKDKIGEFRGNITIQINSPGGDPIEAFGIYDYLKSLNAESITAVIFGQASSAATIIACAADKIIASPNSNWLMHRVTSQPEGNSDQILSAYKTMQALDLQIAEMYSARSGKHSVEEMLAIMNEDTYKTANEALELGLINEVTTLKQTIKMSNQKFANLTEDEQAEMDALKAEIEKLKGELAEYQNKISAMTEEKEDEEVEAVVTNAIKSGKFLAEKKKELVAMAKSNLPAFKAMVEAVPVNIQKTEFTPRQSQGVDKKQLWEDFKAGKIDSKQYSNGINQKQIII